MILWTNQPNAFATNNIYVCMYVCMYYCVTHRAEAKGEPFDEAAARDRIEATLQKEVVLQWIADRSTINYTEAKPAPAAP
jgi:hypothetical protein